MSQLVDPLRDERWGEFVGRAPGATIFHHPTWIGLLESQYGYDFHASCVVDDSGRIVAGVPWARVDSRLTGHRLVALPFSDACPPLLDGGTEEGLTAALEEHRQEAGLGLELRGALAALDAPSPHRYWLHTLPLEPDAEAVARRAKSGIRRGAAKARREGLTFTRSTDVAALDAFYRLHLRTRRRQGVPTQSKRFIRALLPIFAAGQGFVALVNDEGGHAIAAAVFLGAGRHLTYKYGASDRAALGRRPNNLLFSEVIRWACENGYDALDFGRTDLDNEGLRTFKRGWGSEEFALHYTYVGLEVPDDGHSLVERVMGFTIKHSPPATGRLAGAALYRHFG